MTEDREPEDRKLVRAHLAQLAEHFDSVRIFVTRHDGPDEETMAYSDGSGNFYATYGQIREWLERRDEETREDARRHHDDSDDTEPTNGD